MTSGITTCGGVLRSYGDQARLSKHIPAVAIVSKNSMAFFLNRVTGKPVYPIEERPVPKSDTPGEVTSPTQPFPGNLPSVALHDRISPLADIADHHS